MKSFEGRFYFSPTDLSGFLGCPHLTVLNGAVAADGLARPPEYPDPRLEVLRERGGEHERLYREKLEAAGKSVVEITRPPEDLTYTEKWTRCAADTEAAMRAGADAVYQGGLFDGTWVGLADFLIRVDKPSPVFGDWSYEVVDTKLAREAKGGALLQVLLYSELLAGVQGVMPERVHIALAGPDPREESFRVADYAAYFRSVRDRFLEHVASSAGRPLAKAVDPVVHCDLCDWRKRCAEERTEVDHLSLVAGIHRRQMDSLRATDEIPCWQGWRLMLARPHRAATGILGHQNNYRADAA